MAASPERAPFAESRPVPDPTALTTEQTNRAILQLREIIEARLDGGDRVVAVILARLDALPALMKDEIAHLRTLHEEKFRSIEIQFRERDTRTEQSSKDSKVAVDAALQAAKEAVGKQQEASDRAIAKSETSTTKQIDEIGKRIADIVKGTDDKIADLKDRLTTIEGKATGGDKSAGTLFSVIAAGASVVAILGMIVTLALTLRPH